MPTGPPIYGLKKLNMTIVQACGVSSKSYNTSICLYVMLTQQLKAQNKVEVITYKLDSY